MGDWIFNHIGWLLGGALLACFVGIGFIAYAEDKKEARFLEDCLKERKEYECTAMWRAGRSHTQVVPVVVPVGR